MDKLQSLFRSRRFIMLLTGMIAVFSKELLNVELDEEHLNSFLILISSWIVSDSIRRTE